MTNKEFDYPTITFMDDVMEFNCKEVKNFLGDNLSWEDIAKALWKILDDIDTLPDMLHPSEYAMADKCLRMMVKRAEKRHQYLFSDGYKLTKYSSPQPRENKDAV